MVTHRTARTARLVRHVAALALATLFPLQHAHASCGAAFCMVNTNWNMQGLAPESGLRLDLRFEYIDQDQPMTGSRKIAIGEIRKHHDEVRTINRNYIARLDYTFNADWGVAVSAPVVDRAHAHVHNHGGGQIFEQWDFTRLGDVTVLGRRQWMAENPDVPRLAFYGVNFGVKAPTGESDVRNGAGALAERSLQPGTGTTDLLLGAYYSQVLPASASSWFVQALWQAPLDKRDEYRAGRRAGLDAGFRYEASDRIGLMLQLNTLYRSRDSGREAEPDDTGGRFVFLSPGASYAVTKTVQLYSFVHKPVYQHVNGVQLTADWSVVAGLNMRF